MSKIDELTNMFLEEQNPTPPTPRHRRNDPVRGKKLHDRAKKTLIIVTCAVILLGWAIGMAEWSRRYDSTHATQAVEMTSFQGIFMDMDGNGQVDTLLVDVNGDGVIDARMTGEFVEVQIVPPPAQQQTP